jgi:hypothetical protein
MNQPSTFTLNAYQRRQAALLYYFGSMEYLDKIIASVSALTAFTDQTLDYAARVERDKAMRKLGWDEGNLAANWSTHAHPMLRDCLRGLQRQKAMRATEWYDISGVRSALSGMSHYSIDWTLPEEEEKFLALRSEASDLGIRLDETVEHTWTDRDMTWMWDRYRQQFPQLPKFRVRTDVIAETGKRPIRTGVYVPQDDPYGTLQFNWTGNTSGALGPCETLSDLAREYISIVGRDKLWKAPSAAARKPERGEFSDKYFDDWCRTKKHIEFDDWISARNERACATRPCKWYFVELLDGEFETAESSPVDTADRLRCEPGDIVPRSGWWNSPALSGEQSLQFFEQGAKFPDTRKTEWGAVIWYYETDRQK